MEEYIKNTWDCIVEHWFLIASVSIAFIMAVMRTAKADGKVDWLEASMCGLFTYGLWFVLSWFNIPEGASVLIGATVGFKGAQMISAWMVSKVGMDNTKQTEQSTENRGNENGTEE